MLTEVNYIFCSIYWHNLRWSLSLPLSFHQLQQFVYFVSLISLTILYYTFPWTVCVCLVGSTRISPGADCVMSFCCLSKSIAEYTQIATAMKTALWPSVAVFILWWWVRTSFLAWRLRFQFLKCWTYSVPPLLRELELGLGCGWSMLGGSTLIGRSFSCMWGRGSNGLNRAPTLHCGGETDGNMLKTFRGSRQNIVGPKSDSGGSAPPRCGGLGQNIHFSQCVCEETCTCTVDVQGCK